MNWFKDFATKSLNNKNALKKFQLKREIAGGPLISSERKTSKEKSITEKLYFAVIKQIALKSILEFVSEKGEMKTCNISQ